VAYAQGRTFFDADSHVMEPADFIHAYADAALRDRIPPLSVSSGGPSAVAALTRAGARSRTAEETAELERNVIGGAKNYAALGAFEPAERSRALDLLGFHAQLVFATFSLSTFLWLDDLDARYGGCRAHNRAVAAFCAHDDRMLAVAALSLADPARAVVELDAALELGCRAVWIPAEPCGGRSPGHGDLDPVWARMAESGVPFVLHVGGQRMQIDERYMNTGRPVPTDWLGGAENVRSKDLTVLHQPAEEFLSVLVLDGVLERHRGLRGGAIELGATWVPGMLRRLDHAVRIWARSEPELATFERLPSEQAREQLAFTPYPFEEVGELIRDSSDELYLFSSDYPHSEGGRDPIGRFERSLGELSEATRQRFYATNFAKLVPSVRELAPVD